MKCLKRWVGTRIETEALPAVHEVLDCNAGDELATGGGKMKRINARIPIMLYPPTDLCQERQADSVIVCIEITTAKYSSVQLRDLLDERHGRPVGSIIEEP
jgi:hypothetical protein